MQTLKPTLTIDIWSDLVCPWCWIAKKRFEQGLNRFEFRDQVVIRHHSYRLAGGTPAMPFKDAIVKKLGSQHSAELMMNQDIQRYQQRRYVAQVIEILLFNELLLAPREPVEEGEIE